MDLRSVVKEKKYVPKWKENDKSEPHEQFVINFKNFPGSSQLNKYISTEGKIDFSNFLIENIGKVENLRINGNEVGNGYALAQARHPDLLGLFVELFNYAFPEGEDLSEGE